MQKKFPELTANLPSNPLPPSHEVVPVRAEDVDAIAQSLRTAAGRRRQGQVRQADRRPDPPRRARDRDRLPSRGACAPCRLDAPDREHDPPLDLLRTPRDRGDEARRRHELVRARPVHARGPDLRTCRLARRDPAAAARQELALPAILGRIESSSDVEALSFMVNALILLLVGPRRRRSRLRLDATALPAGLAPRGIPPGTPRPPEAAEPRTAPPAPRRARARARAQIVLPYRLVEPETVVAHVGPTNSGKTHSALQFLAETGRGVFAAPLRMLAQEAHRRLSAQLGAEHVGLVTGEERVNERAPIICCTAEMAPLSRRGARARRGAVGRRRRARLRVDAAAARRRVQAHPPARRGRGAAADPARLPATPRSASSSARRRSTGPARSPSRASSRERSSLRSAAAPCSRSPGS